MLATAAAAIVVAAGLPSVAALADPPAATPDVNAAAAARPVQLITGDVATLSGTAAHPHVAVRMHTASGPGAGYSTVSLGHQAYVVPTVAKPYLDRVLDRSLFDVSALSAATRTAVTVTKRAGTTPHVPGLTVTSSTASTEAGYLTAAGARAFGTALTAQWQRDTASGHYATSLFGVTHLAATGAAGPLTPDFPQQTLTVKIVDRTGRAVPFAFIGLINVDDGRKYANFLEVDDGVGKISVPLGHYSGIAEDDTFRSGVVRTYLDPISEYTLSGPGQTMTFDFASATHQPTVATPRPATITTISAEWDRNTPTYGLGFGTDSFGSGLFYASTDPVVHGSMEWLTTFNEEHDSATSPYTYDLSYHYHDVIPLVQHHTIAPDQLATVDSRYYTGGGEQELAFGRTPFYPFQFIVFGEDFPIDAPIARTEYVYAPAAAVWFGDYAGFGDSSFTDLSDAPRSYVPGAGYEADWARGALAPGVPGDTVSDPFPSCYACRDKNHLSVVLPQFVDSDGHAGIAIGFDPETGAATEPISRFRFYVGGKLVSDKLDFLGTQLKVSPHSTTYRAVETAYRGSAGLHTSATATTDVSFVSDARSGATLAPNVFCPFLAAPSCSALPLLTASVDLPTSLASTMPVGSYPSTFTVGHIPGARDSAITSVSFATTDDGGATFQTLPVTSLGSGRYGVTLINPVGQLGKGVGTRVVVTDAAGGRLVQTVGDAYYVEQT